MEFIRIVIYLSIYIGLVSTAFYILSFIAGTKREKLLYTDDELPKVSVIIPAYNEEETIEATVRSIMDSDYPDFEVLVIDDGSKDRTLKIAKALAAKLKDSRLKILHKTNGGKGTALNLGISKAKGEVIFTMDADTFVHRQSVRRMVRYFKNPRVMSVTPAMIIHKPRSILQRVQHMEYVMGLFLRKTFAALESIYIAPGAFSAYRKTFFDTYGGYDVGNITEDLEMALRIQSKGYLTENCPDAPAYTVAPSKFGELLVQRRRWYYGLIKNILNYRHMFGKKYGDLGMFVLPIAWISIFFAVFITCYLFIRTLFNVYKEITFLSSINFDFANFANLSVYSIERALFLFLTNPTTLFVLIFMVLLGFYIYYASRKIGRISGIVINLTLFFLLFALLFGFWWVVSIIYAIFYKEIKWR